MGSRALSVFAILSATVFGLAASRAVNISNTWMLPEEGFPVFYRYFRDRISWYEADAVCQFHHANLVTVDSTSQYDAIRAYLKEMDITNNVWIGLSRTSNKSKFTWSDFRPLSGEGYWQEAVPEGSDPLCAAMDPAADFWWKAFSCGGPAVASFICELPVPSWAMGPGGCLLTELPSLTVLYNPEQSALELTSDCGLDGTKRIACKGNADRDEIMRQLTCSMSNDDFDDKSTKAPSAQGSASDKDPSQFYRTTKPWPWTSNTVDGASTRHRRETEQTPGAQLVKSTTEVARAQAVTTPRTPIYTSKQPAKATSTTKAHDVTLEASVESSFEATAKTRETVTERIEGTPEAFVTASVTTEFKTGESQQEEFPSAINQGQLFSIIENGTMFDIIELNETGTEDTRPRKDTSTTSIASPPPKLPLSTKTNPTTATTLPETPTETIPTTTTISQKRPLLKSPLPTNAPQKNPEESKIPMASKTTKKPSPKEIAPPKTYAHKEMNINDLQSLEDDKSLSKEVEMFPIDANSLVKLNRTFRKELPKLESIREDNSVRKTSLVKKENEKVFADQKAFEHVTITLHKETTKMQIAPTSLVATAKKNQELLKIFPKHESLEIDEPIKPKDILIDPKISDLNLNASENNESEVFQAPASKTPERLQSPPQTTLDPSKTAKILPLQPQNPTATSSPSPSPTTPPSLRPQNLPKLAQTPPSTEEPLEPVPQQQPRPNRKRQLTRPESRTFYPYFFSRVLG